jgi:hypothetical protein
MHVSLIGGVLVTLIMFYILFIVWVIRVSRYRYNPRVARGPILKDVRRGTPGAVP